MATTTPSTALVPVAPVSQTRSGWHWRGFPRRLQRPDPPRRTNWTCASSPSLCEQRQLRLFQAGARTSKSLPATWKPAAAARCGNDVHRPGAGMLVSPPRT